MTVVYSIADLQPESGGPTRSIGNLAAAIAARGVEVRIVALEYGSWRARPLTPSLGEEQIRLAPCRGAFCSRIKYASGYGATMREACRDAQGLVVHRSGVWLPVNHTAAVVTGALNAPSLLTAHGMLLPGAWRFSAWKKWFAWRLFQRRDLQRAKALHATSITEARSFRALGLPQPIALVPFGVEAPPPNFQPPHSASPRTALFLSRVHPIKGLLDWVEAWRRVRPCGWRMVVAGADEAGHRKEVEAAVHNAGLEGVFEFVGPVDQDTKWNLFAQADLFVLPSHSENFGHALAEALACGVPALTTRGAPWSVLETHACGWWVRIGAGPLAEALRRCVALPDAERKAMGARGRELVSREFSWRAVAAEMLAVYEWLRGGPAPSCVWVDELPPEC